MVKKKIISALSILLAVSVLTTSTVFAFATSGTRIPAKTASYSWGSSITTMYKTAWKTAANDWYSASNASIYYSSSSSNTVDTYSESGNTNGYVTKISTGNKITSFAVMINTNNCTTSTTARATSGHEIGHLLGLDDLSSGIAIMYSSRDRNSIYKPQADDIEGVLYVYGY